MAGDWRGKNGLVAIALGFVVVIGALSSGGLAGHPASTAPASLSAAMTADDPVANSSSVSTFLHAGSADIETTVDAGLFEATFRAADEDAQQAVVEERIDRLDDRIDALETDRAELESWTDEGESEAIYDARIARFSVQLVALEEAIDAVERRANETDVDPVAVEELRENASALFDEPVERTMQPADPDLRS